MEEIQLMERKQIELYKTRLDDIIHEIDGVEFWYARELMIQLGYGRWENFFNAIDRAIDSCKSAGVEASDHFREITKMVRVGSQRPTRESEKRLSQNIYERGVDDAGFGRIRSKGDAALFGGKTTQQMKEKLGVKENRPLADFLPTLTIAAKNLATEMTNFNVEQKDLQGENAITDEHVQNNTSVRSMLGERGIKPEELPAAEDMKKLERRAKAADKKIAQESGTLPELK